ncbi:hypothetical protein AMTR_s00116p00087810 [Amborella trichopoda]|uniref:Integrase catalytic domain-containing protein n=1 Tax=Amborella trichopoda TaxID=13333 RepID=W1NSF5_AMBTC|nr:hypothetical protein AMTR_s00116p00087810 [Amborella trichopoda]
MPHKTRLTGRGQPAYLSPSPSLKAYGQAVHERHKQPSQSEWEEPEHGRGGPAFEVCHLHRFPRPMYAETAAQLFFIHVVKLWGVPKDIVSNRDARFTRRFWHEWFDFMGTRLNFSISNHPQTDGQTERMNVILEYLRHYVTANKHNWVSLLDLASFCHNLHRRSSAEKSALELATGWQPLASP